MDLLDFFVNGVLAQRRVEFFQLEALRGSFLILRGDVTAGTRLAAGFVLGALEDHLDPVFFLCHGVS